MDTVGSEWLSAFLRLAAESEGQEGVRLRAVLFTALIAVGFAVTETYLRFFSRAKPANKQKRLGLGDALFWIEWVVAASFALAASEIANSHAHKPIGTAETVTAFGALFLSYSTLPFVARDYAFDSSGKIRVPWLFILNIAAILILMAAVAVGAKVYD